MQNLMEKLMNGKNVHVVTEEDIEYFKNKVLTATNDAAKQKYQKQLDVLEDAVVIYKHCSNHALR